jgi:hypothetical protein
MALGLMANLVNQQAMLIACEDLYRLIAVCALGGAAVVALQRQLD